MPIHRLRFHEELAAELDCFLDEVLQKRSPRLIINVPPQEGESEQVSRRFPAYVVGRDPNLRVVACSYSATLALQFSIDVQLIMDEPSYARLFPESIIPGFATKHNAAVRHADHFELVRHHGSYRCAGVQGSIAGFPCDLLIVDDPYKDHLEAHSLVVREAACNNFVSVLLPRLQEGRGVLICCTRWHQDELVGRLLERSLYCFFIIGHNRRRIVHHNVTRNPNALWVSLQLHQAWEWDEQPQRFLIFDRDAKFGGDVVLTVKAMGSQPIRPAYRGPWRNGIAERWVGSVRRELLDHVIVLNGRHLRRLLNEDIRYYHEDRTHLGLGKDTPGGRIPASAPSSGCKVVSLPRLGGLHHRYIVAA